jgi:hypothetical protein
MMRVNISIACMQYAASLGVGRILFVCANRVEKAYLSSPKLAPEAIAESLQLGM